jgi:hypothetical protein
MYVTTDRTQHSLGLSTLDGFAPAILIDRSARRNEIRQISYRQARGRIWVRVNLHIVQAQRHILAILLSLTGLTKFVREIDHGATFSIGRSVRYAKMICLSELQQ